MPPRSVFIAAAGLLILVLCGWQILRTQSAAAPDPAVPQAQAQSHRIIQPLPNPQKQPPGNGTLADTTTPEERVSDEIPSLDDLKSRAFEITKDWETKNARPITTGYKLGEKAITLVPPADAALIDSLRTVFGPYGAEPAKLSELLRSMEIETEKYRVLVYQPGPDGVSQDTIMSIKIDKYEDINLDPITGNLRVSSNVFNVPKPGNTARFGHLFKVTTE